MSDKILYSDHKKYGIFSSSADHEKLSLTVKGILGVVFSVAPLFGIDLSGVGIDETVEIAVDTILVITTGIGVFAAIKGFLRKIKLRKQG